MFLRRANFVIAALCLAYHAVAAGIMRSRVGQNEPAKFRRCIAVMPELRFACSSLPPAACRLQPPTASPSRTSSMPRARWFG